MAAPQVIVVGGGCKALPPHFNSDSSADSLPVSGLSAAHTVYLNGGNVLVLDKQGMYSLAMKA